MHLKLKINVTYAPCFILKIFVTLKTLCDKRCSKNKKVKNHVQRWRRLHIPPNKISKKKKNEAELKEGIFIGFNITEILKDDQFFRTPNELKGWSINSQK